MDQAAHYVLARYAKSLFRLWVRRSLLVLPSADKVNGWRQTLRITWLQMEGIISSKEQNYSLVQCRALFTRTACFKSSSMLRRAKESSAVKKKKERKKKDIKIRRGKWMEETWSVLSRDDSWVVPLRWCGGPECFTGCISTVPYAVPNESQDPVGPFGLCQRQPS